ncbi:MAG: aminotransferase class I/II-fold pyridoxal phosphate-dependent enzyme [Microthrixaceae bacterium]|nr:aminotransferase class I/II-fold pyridoxal phosphate-dependent enzyme [Microthrixaceae bacterium]
MTLGGPIDLTLGSPCDAPPEVAVRAMSEASDTLGPYGRSVGSPAYREAAAAWMRRRLNVDVDPGAVAACVGTKEFVGGLALLLAPLVDRARDVVLVPAVAYPTYAVGAELAGCRVVRVPMTDRFTLDLDAVDPADAARARLLWVNSPGNPAGGLDDLGAAAAWARERGIVVCSDECYVEFTWAGGSPGTPDVPGATILSHGLDGVLALHSLSKRSNLAGGRAGCYAGDPELVATLGERRRELGLVVPGPVQAAAVAAWGDDAHVALQRERYVSRLTILAEAAGAAGFPDVRLPAGGLYLWLNAGGDDRAATRRLASLGVLVQPGSVYGPAGAGWIRMAAVRPEDEIVEAARRIQTLSERAAADGGAVDSQRF